MSEVSAQETQRSSSSERSRESGGGDCIALALVNSIVQQQTICRCSNRRMLKPIKWRRLHPVGALCGCRNTRIAPELIKVRAQEAEEGETGREEAAHARSMLAANFLQMLLLLLHNNNALWAVARSIGPIELLPLALCLCLLKLCVGLRELKLALCAG